jgi:hypothetical protein
MNFSNHTCSSNQTAQLLARLAAEAVGASDFALLEDDQPAEFPDSVHYPIRVDGLRVAVLVFTIQETALTREQRFTLERTAAAIEAVHGLPLATARRALRIANLDAELADIKIRERARGLIEEGVPAAAAVATVLQHVDNVLERRPLEMVFNQLLPDLEERIAERKLLMKAKAVLREEHGMSEEQAYLHLRMSSRSTRKRLREVAEEVTSQAAAITRVPMREFSPRAAWRLRPDRAITPASSLS